MDFINFMKIIEECVNTFISKLEFLICIRSQFIIFQRIIFSTLRVCFIHIIVILIKKIKITLIKKLWNIQFLREILHLNKFICIFSKTTEEHCLKKQLFLIQHLIHKQLHYSINYLLLKRQMTTQIIFKTVETKQKQPVKLTSNNKMFKHQSEPKFRTMKQQILKIPKVKQMLNKDKFIFSQDIQKRLELIGSLKQQKFKDKQLAQLHDLRKAKQKKKNKRHKTNFKIPLTRKNINSMNNLIAGHIDRNTVYKNQQVIFLKQYTENAPFYLDKLSFMDQLHPVKKKYHEKYPQYKQGVLSKNKLLLEHVILNRNIKREMKLDIKKQEKQHVKHVYNQL